MRYYSLVLSSANGGNTLQNWTSYPGGSYDPGALNIIMDLVVYPQATPMGGSTITIEGVPAELLTNAQSFGALSDGSPTTTLTLKGGMGLGLPLANPKQIGTLVSGSIFQSWGTWIGTQVALTFTLVPSPFTQSNPGPLVLNWIAGTPLATALKNTLQIAYPAATVSMNISNIVLGHDEKHAAKTLTGLATYLNGITSTGVQIVKNGDSIRVFDSSYKPSPKRVAFTDFVGQPMWIAPNTIQSRFVLRGDIQVGDIIEMPQGYSNLPGFTQQTAAAMPSQVNYQAAIQGQFWVQSVRHLGNLRQPNGNAWCTIVNCVTVGTPQ